MQLNLVITGGCTGHGIWSINFDSQPSVMGYTEWIGNRAVIISSQRPTTSSEQLLSAEKWTLGLHERLWINQSINLDLFIVVLVKTTAGWVHWRRLANNRESQLKFQEICGKWLRKQMDGSSVAGRMWTDYITVSHYITADVSWKWWW